MNEPLKSLVESVGTDLDAPLSVLGLLFVAFAFFGTVLDDFLGNATVVVVLPLSFIAVTLFIGLVKYRD